MSDLAAGPEIERIAEHILRDSKCIGIFPTPVSKITAYTELKLDEGIDLSRIPESFLAKHGHAFREKVQSALSKILGAIDLREKTIYLDLQQNPNRKRFVQLHETGHHVLPWQKDIFCVDDETTLLAPEVKEEFELEASHFASVILFQHTIFDYESKKLPLSLKSAIALSERFGASRHASIRRYVERSPKRCALLVLEKASSNGDFSAPVRNYFQSRSFSKAFGQISWPSPLGMEHSFIQELKMGRKYHEDGTLNTTNDNMELVTLRYHFFHNTYNTFIFMFPPSEKISSRVRIITS